MKIQLPQRRNIRLYPEAYAGRDRVVHITICTREKLQIFADDDIACEVKCQIVDLSCLEKVKVFAYAIMPDHIHLLVSLGIWEKPGDYVRYIKGNLSVFLRKHFGLRNVWQKGFYDHVMRKEEDLNETVKYILNNPVRKGIVDDWKKYQWCGSLVFDIDGF